MAFEGNLFGATVAVVSFAASIRYVLLVNTVTTVLTNQFLPLWFSSLAGFAGLRLYLSGPRPSLSCAQSISCIIQVALACLCAIGYVYANELAPAFWALVLGVAKAASLGFSRSKYVRVKSKFTPLVFIWELAVLLVSVMLAAGAVVAVFAASFPAPGTFAAVSLPSGRVQRLHYLCEGPRGGDRPVVWVMSSPAHGVVDFYGLQHYMSHGGRRVCTVDPPGFGWSEPLLGASDDDSLWMPALLAAAREPSPYVLLGWGGGGSAVVQYARAFPALTAGVVLMGVAPPDVEFSEEAAKRGWNATQTGAYKAAQLASRVKLTDIILGLALPLGLLPFFDPVSPYPTFWPQEKVTEFKAQSWKNSMWVNQKWGIVHMIHNASDPLRDKTALPVPLAAISCQLNATTACWVPPGSDPMSADECAAAQFDVKYDNEATANLTRALGPPALVITQTEPPCSLTFPVSDPKWTANAVLEATSDFLAQ